MTRCRIASWRSQGRTAFQAVDMLGCSGCRQVKNLSYLEAALRHDHAFNLGNLCIRRRRMAAWRELLNLNSNWQLELPLALSGLMKDF